jgi:hypothetical protein
MTLTWAWAFDVGADGDVAVGAAKIPDRELRAAAAR